MYTCLLPLEGGFIDDRDYISFVSVIFASGLAPSEFFIKSEEMRQREIEEKVEGGKVREFKRFAQNHPKRHTDSTSGGSNQSP